MDLGLREKVILITGGAKGIGAAIAHECGREGAIPVILDHDESALERIQSELRQKGLEHATIQVELTEASECALAVEASAGKYGRIDGLVNNAGVNDGVGLEHGSPERFAGSLKRNLLHYYSMTQAALPFLKRSNGSIVNMSSKVAITGQGGTSGYAAAKGAILGLTAEWAEEFSAYGIRVNAIIPAEVMTPQYQDWIKKSNHPETELRRIAEKVPLDRRMTEPQEIAAMTIFLLSPLSAGVTGQQLFVDGGYVHLDRRST
jgi:L-fucose dehydrogenase